MQGRRFPLLRYVWSVSRASAQGRAGRLARTFAPTGSLHIAYGGVYADLDFELLHPLGKLVHRVRNDQLALFLGFVCWLCLFVCLFVCRSIALLVCGRLFG